MRQTPGIGNCRLVSSRPVALGCRPKEVPRTTSCTRSLAALDGSPERKLKKVLGRRSALASFLSLSFGSVVSSSDAIDLSAEPAWDNDQSATGEDSWSVPSPPTEGSAPLASRTSMEESIEERRIRVGREVQKEYNRQQLQEELNQRTQDFVDSMWMSLE